MIIFNYVPMQKYHILTGRKEKIKKEERRKERKWTKQNRDGEGKRNEHISSYKQYAMQFIESHQGSGREVSSSLEPIIQSEVSQKDKDHYRILTHIYGIQKDVNDNPIRKTEKETQMYRTDFWTLWEKARVGCFKRTASKHGYYLG